MIAKLIKTSKVGLIAALMTFVEAMVFNWIYPQDNLSGEEYALFIAVNLFIAAAIFALIKKLKVHRESSEVEKQQGGVS